MTTARLAPRGGCRGMAAAGLPIGVRGPCARVRLTTTRPRVMAKQGWRWSGRREALEEARPTVKGRTPTPDSGAPALCPTLHPRCPLLPGGGHNSIATAISGAICHGGCGKTEGEGGGGGVGGGGQPSAGIEIATGEEEGSAAILLQPHPLRSQTYHPRRLKVMVRFPCVPTSSLFPISVRPPLPTQPVPIPGAPRSPTRPPARPSSLSVTPPLLPAAKLLLAVICPPYPRRGASPRHELLRTRGHDQ